MGFETKIKEPKEANYSFSSILAAFSSRTLADATSYLENSPLEIAEAFIIAKIRLLPSNAIEINVFRFVSPDINSRSPLEAAEIIIPFFLHRGAQCCILSVDTFTRQISRIWSSISYQTSSSFSFSDFLFLWAIADFKSTINNKLGISSIRISAITPNVIFSLLKIKSYPFDSDCFRRCLQIESANTKFQHLNQIKSDGRQEKFRFGYFLLDPSGCLIPYLDGEESIRSSLLAGVWCTNGAENDQNSTANLQVWLSLLRYAFTPKGRRAFSISPVLAIHNSSSNSVLFYSVRPDVGANKPPRSLYLDFSSGNSSSPWHGYADRLYFHYFSGTEDLKSRVSRTTSQTVVIHLSPLSSLRLPYQTSLADYKKILEAVSRLASDLGCQISKGLTPTIASTSSSNKVSQADNNNGLDRDKQNNKNRKRSVKFSLPSKTSTLPTPANLPAGFEVPEASMLLEESISLAPPTAYSPYRYFPSPTPLQTRCCRYAHSHHHRQGHPERNQTNNSSNEIARLEAMVEKLLSAQILQQTPTNQPEEEKTKKGTVSVGTSTPVGIDVCNVAVNTSSIWPTPTDIGLVSPSKVPESIKKMVESVGIQCKSVLLSRGSSPIPCPIPADRNQIVDFPQSSHPTFPRTLEFPQSTESVLSLDNDSQNKPASTQQVQCEPDENTIGNTGYSHLLAGIQQVLQQATPNLRKTVSVPGELSLLAQQPPRCISAADNIGRMWQPSTNDIDTDIEADVIRHQLDCEKEVAEKLELTATFPSTELVERGSTEKHASQNGSSGVGIPATTAINSFTFATDFDPSVDRPHSRRRKGNSKSTDESAVLMGLARKYLPPSVIAQLAPSDSVTQDVSDFSLATRRYLEDNGLTSSANNGSAFESTLLDAERWIGGNIYSSSSRGSSTIPRLTILEGNENCESFLYTSKIFPENVVEKQSETNEEGNYDAPILNLEHLRKLPKFL
ncbi:hypothetical protein ACTXT7_003015 [Hymenolepis weldensis]